MPSLTLKNLPPELHRRLKARARQRRRSLNREAIECLREATAAERVDSELLLAQLRALRSAVKGRLTGAALTRLKSHGRP